MHLFIDTSALIKFYHNEKGTERLGIQAGRLAEKPEDYKHSSYN